MKYRRYEEPVRTCSYLPSERSRMIYLEVDELSSEQYLSLINQGWRRFGFWLFRPDCPDCKACQPIRIPVKEYKPNRIQRRVIKKNSGLLKLQISEPSYDNSRVELYLQHHRHHAESRGWRDPEDGESAISSILSFTISPLPVQEWSFYLGEELVAVAYVDELPDGFSGIYFYHSPAHRTLSLGNWICISMILEARERNLDYVYLGYYIKGNISMEYKAAFTPNQILLPDGSWNYYLRN